MSEVEQLKSELRIQSVTYANEMARVRKELQSLLDYDLSVAIEMATGDAWDVEPDRVLRHLNNISKIVLLVKQIGER